MVAQADRCSAPSSRFAAAAPAGLTDEPQGRPLQQQDLRAVGAGRLRPAGCCSAGTTRAFRTSAFAGLVMRGFDRR